MTKKKNELIVPDEMIMNKIYLVKGKKVMLDRDLAELYGVETKVLKQAVRRNANRFPPDFMFEMNKNEFENWRSQNVTSREDRQGLRYAPLSSSLELKSESLDCIIVDLTDSGYMGPEALVLYGPDNLIVVWD